MFDSEELYLEGIHALWKMGPSSQQEADVHAGINSLQKLETSGQAGIKKDLSSCNLAIFQ